MPILVDTHALVWFDSANRRLGQRARVLIDEAALARQAWIYPLTWWEVQMGVDRKRILLDQPVEQWRLDLLAAGFQERPITGVDTILQARLADFHKDPADRLLVAVAANAGFTLVTADEKILGWTRTVERFDCRV